jgi:hypothetical protein
MSRTYVKWWLDYCAAITRASYPPLVLRGGLWAPIVRGGDVVRGEGMEVGKEADDVERYASSSGRRRI